jgi:hypothetical protein
MVAFLLGVPFGIGYLTLADGGYRLDLYSHFTLKTRLNFYAHWWSGGS